MTFSIKRTGKLLSAPRYPYLSMPLCIANLLSLLLRVVKILGITDNAYHAQDQKPSKRIVGNQDL